MPLGRLNHVGVATPSIEKSLDPHEGTKGTKGSPLSRASLTFVVPSCLRVKQ